MLKLQKKFLAFKEELEAQGGDYFNLEVSHGARLCGDLDPDLDPNDYPGKQFSKNYCYWFEFERYLKFFEVGLDHTTKNSKSRGGRPRNEGLHLAVNYIADFWVFKLGRKYTLDHHEKILGTHYLITNRYFPLFIDTPTQAGRKSAVECNGISPPDCETDKSSRDESRSL
jgi:hypothetical protein